MAGSLLLAALKRQMSSVTQRNGIWGPLMKMPLQRPSFVEPLQRPLTNGQPPQRMGGIKGGLDSSPQGDFFELPCVLCSFSVPFCNNLLQVSL